MEFKIEDALLEDIKDNDISKEEAKKIQFNALGDDVIKKYLPYSRILTYNELSKYKTIEELLKKDLDYVILLYQQKQNYGHWVLLSRYNNIIEFFSSYGDYIDEPLNWTKLKMRIVLGEDKPYLSQLLSNAINSKKFDVIYNSFDFQNKNDLSIATCGRWCVLRIHMILLFKLPLNKFIQMIKRMKKEKKVSYDILVSQIIDEI
jgi:hypothetical protein